MEDINNFTFEHIHSLKESVEKMKRDISGREDPQIWYSHTTFMMHLNHLSVLCLDFYGWTAVFVFLMYMKKFIKSCIRRHEWN